jgi:hypothetical protein
MVSNVASSVSESGQTDAVAQSSRCFRLGFSPFPWDYGADTRAESLKWVASEGGDIVMHHVDFYVPWAEAIADKPLVDAVDKTWEGKPDQAFNTTPPGEYLQDGTEVYLALTPMNQGRNNLAESGTGPAPQGFLERDFDDPALMEAYLNYCRRMVKHFQPDYLAIGIEMNELFHNNPAQWPHYVTMFKHTYAGLKQDYPDLPVFSTVTIHGLLQEDRSHVAAERAAIKEFLQINDLAGISFYPSLSGGKVMEDPSIAFDFIRDLAGAKPIAICETGIPAEATQISMWPMAPGTPELQRNYYEKLFEAAQRDGYRFITVFLHRDYDRMWEKLKKTRPEWQKAWQDIGVFDENNNPRPAWNLWQKTLSLPLDTAHP